MHGAAIAEADFRLGGVYVDVDQRWVDLQEQAAARLTATMQLIAVGLADGVLNHLVAYVTAVDESVLHFAFREDRRGNHGPAVELEQVVTLVNAAAGFEKIIAEHLTDAAFAGVGRPGMGCFTIATDCEADFGMRQRLAANSLHAVGLFGAGAFQKLTAGRRVEIQIAHFNDGAGR